MPACFITQAEKRIIMSYSVAIDGPAGAGKSTIAKLISKQMGYIYVDTGAMYRAMAVYFNQNNIDPADEAAINAAVDNVKITIEYKDGEQQVILNGENVTSLLRTEATGNMASKTSKYKAVRSKLVDLQRELAAAENVVMDGRDIGTTVLPDANVKIYLTASSDARARRRYDELKAKGEECDLQKIKEDIEQRDYQDMHRDISPLKQADDAVLVDSSDMGIDEVVEAIKTVINSYVPSTSFSYVLLRLSSSCSVKRSAPGLLLRLLRSHEAELSADFTNLNRLAPAVARWRGLFVWELLTLSVKAEAMTERVRSLKIVSTTCKNT